MSIRRSSLICVAYLQVYERVADNRWWPNIGGLLYILLTHARLAVEFHRRRLSSYTFVVRDEYSSVF